MPKDQSSDQQRPRSRARLRWLLLAATALFISGLGLKTLHIMRATRSLESRQNELQELFSRGLKNVDPEAAESLLLGVRDDVLVIEGESRLFRPLMPYLGWLPKIGATVAAAPQLIDMADAGTEAALLMFRGLKPGLLLIQQENDTLDFRLAQLVRVLDVAEPDLKQAGLRLEQVGDARDKIAEINELPWRVQELIGQIDQWLPLGHAGLELALFVPELMGVDRSKRYLVIAQNEDELRPTGGFISGVAVVTLEDGRIAELTFQDAYEVDSWETMPYDAPPQPLSDLMGIRLFLFRDANFWPDFPTSAQVALDLYQYGQEADPFDGMIAVDQRFIQLLLEATGPVQVPGESVSLNSRNVINRFREAWAFQGDPQSEAWREWLQNRKTFIGTFATAIMNRVESEFALVDPVRLVKNLHDAANAKHLQIYMKDTSIASVLNDLGWDGRLEGKDGGDLLMVVDTNVGYSKANAYINRSIDYHVDLTEVPSASLTINYVHSGTNNGNECIQDISYAQEVVSDYLNLVDQCYWNYLRVYVPLGSHLLDSTQHDVPISSLVAGSGWQGPAKHVNDLPGLDTFANFLMVPRGNSISSTFEYQLPENTLLLSDEQIIYELAVYKQAGLPPVPLKIAINLPENAELIMTEPPASVVNGRQIIFSFDLNSDSTISVRYR